MKKSLITTILSIAAAVSLADDPVDFTIKSADIYAPPIATNMPAEITVSSIVERTERPNLQTFVMSIKNSTPNELILAVDSAVDAWFASNNARGLLFLNRYHLFPKCTERCITEYPDNATYVRCAVSNETANLNVWPIDHVIISVPTININDARKIIADKYIKLLKIHLRKQGKSIVEYTDPETGEKINPLDKYANDLQTALSSPGFGNLSEIMAEVGVEVQTTPVPDAEKLEEIKWKILIDELKIDAYKNKLVYWLGTEKFNEFVEEYNNGKPVDNQ